jgi:hypothetical protein
MGPDKGVKEPGDFHNSWNIGNQSTLKVGKN